MERGRANRPTRVIIMGAAGRDFHNFNCCFRDNPLFRVVAFTAAQIPYISDRRYPPTLAGPLYPKGIPIHPEEQLPDLIRRHNVWQVVFAYSDISHEQLMHTASLVLACGADFRLIGPDATMLASRRPVVSVCAVRTGCGKSQVVRYFCDILRERGIRPVVVRHPMPYGDLAAQAVQRFAEPADLDRFHCTIEEREEYEHLLEHGAIVYAGVDYRRILRRAEKEAQVILWDGGNNDLPFFRSDLEIVVADPLRPGHETSWYPGEVNLRRARIIIVNKVNAAEPAAVEAVEAVAKRVNPAAMVVRTASLVTVTDGERLRGKRVLVVEDGPSVTHGSLPSGAGLAAARQHGAHVVDPRPWARGSLAGVYAAFPHVGPVLPAMGYSPAQVADLAATIAAVPCDLVLAATPIDLNRLLASTRSIIRVSYAISEIDGTPLRDAICGLLDRTGGSY
ncbi:cyclic 2,3-diphosphoglycerate synthase [Geomobilimonas luticola]|uniref:Cyclic 2,3-diphosphoglycerate synthase n=1 Tax=Geomobilimonas luticola TaxID=1114878 RepID=A0ABS5S960_9BACT|nr:cyclic 2,3-diphosphoglycerate synthase [Geomobilimonas luticola]MBT0651910.1 cyclic 2,3-diphosphoglycerate synthase [Geomobilimonas luticola]